eukprot:2186401-Pyramimonas_sp.AAC.1
MGHTGVEVYQFSWVCLDCQLPPHLSPPHHLSLYVLLVNAVLSQRSGRGSGQTYDVRSAVFGSAGAIACS